MAMLDGSHLRLALVRDHLHLLGLLLHEPLRLDVVMVLDFALLFGALAPDRLLQRLAPIRMARDGHLWLPGRPPVHVPPDMILVRVALPRRMILRRPGGIILMPPGVVVPDMMVVEVAPPVRMILRRVLWLVRPPPVRRVPAVPIVVAPPFGMIFLDP